MNTAKLLLALLGNQRDLLLQLLEITREERACLLSNRLERLEEIVEEQARNLHEQAGLSRRIVRTLERLSHAREGADPISLTGIFDALTAAEARDARAFYQELSALAADIQREGRVNWHLAQQAIHYVEYTLKLIGRAKDGPRTYSPVQHGESRRPIQLLVDSCA